MEHRTTEADRMDRRLNAREGKGAPGAEFFRSCFDRFPDPVLVTDRDGNVLYLNEAALALTGRDPGEGGVLHCRDVFEASGLEKRTVADECIRAGVLDGVTVRAEARSADLRPFSLSGQVIMGPGDEPAACLFILRPASSAPASDAVWDHIFASVIDNFPMPFFTVDTNLTITYMNEHLENLTGFRCGEVVDRMTCGELLKTPYCGTDDCPLKQAMEKRTSATGLRRMVRDREGREIPVAVHCSMITDSENRVIGGFKALRDITPLVQAEQKIRMLVEITSEGILLVDENERITYANSRMAEILDRPKEELVGGDVREILPLQIWSMAHELSSRLDMEHYQEVRFCSTIQPALSSNRKDRVFETCIVAARFGKGFITCLYFQDLTKHIEIERELFKANNFLANIIRSSADGIVVADMAGNILMYNEAAERILGYGSGEVIGVPGALYKIAGMELLKENMRRMRSGEYGPAGKLASTRITLVSKDGEEVPVSFSAAIIKKNGTEIGTVGIFSDLRSQVRMRRELEETRMQLMQADKIASIGRLAAGVAHEINNPLSGILIFAEMLHKEIAGQNRQWSDDLQEIIDQSMRCKEIVARLLDFSRHSVNQRFEYDINVIVNRSVDLLSHQGLFHNVVFAIDLQADIPIMVGDAGQLQQVFTNFILNAGTAMNGRGKITITSGFDPGTGQVVLRFADTGPGIPADIIGKVFEPFFTTKRPGEGTGLGLSVAYGIIQQHGGHISADNLPSGGAVFTVTLPLKCPEHTIEFTC